MVNELELGIGADAVVGLQPLDLQNLAAEADQHDAAPKFGLAAVPHSVRRNRSNPSPAPAMPQPLAWVIGTIPWTLSKPSSSPVCGFGESRRRPSLNSSRW